MNVRPFDFREIAALDDTAVAIRNWLSKSTSFFSDEWVEATGYTAKLALGKISTQSYEQTLEGIPREDLCCVAKLHEQIPSLLCASKEQLQILVADLLCLSKNDLQEDWEPGKIELDLAAFVIERMADSLSRGWMGEGEIPIEIGELSKDARKLRLFRSKDLVTNVSVEVECKLDTATLQWLLPNHHLVPLMHNSVDQREGEPAATPSKELIAQLPLEVRTLLGSAKLPVTELANLKPGQLIVLNQRIDSPMVATVDGQPSFECWPGRLGNQQAVQVSQCFND